MIFDPKIGIKTIPNRAKDDPKEMHFSSSIYVSILDPFWLRFGSVLVPFWILKIIKKSEILGKFGNITPKTIPRGPKTAPRGPSSDAPPPS